MGLQGKRKDGRDRKGKGKARTGPVKPVKEVKFNEEDRRDFLTGFGKRKQARKLASRQKAEARDKEEFKKMRDSMRQQRRDQAAENVRQAQAAFEDPAQDGEGEDDRVPQQEILEDDHFQTQVTVEEDWDPRAEEEARRHHPAPKTLVHPSRQAKMKAPRKPDQKGGSKAKRRHQ